jgi:hypothetical protein
MRHAEFQFLVPLGLVLDDVDIGPDLVCILAHSAAGSCILPEL